MVAHWFCTRFTNSQVHIQWAGARAAVHNANAPTPNNYFPPTKETQKQHHHKDDAVNSTTPKKAINDTKLIYRHKPPWQTNDFDIIKKKNILNQWGTFVLWQAVIVAFRKEIPEIQSTLEHFLLYFD